MQQTPRDSGLVVQKVAPLGVWKASAAGTRALTAAPVLEQLAHSKPLPSDDISRLCHQFGPQHLNSLQPSHLARQQLYRRNAEKERRGPICMPMCILPPEGC